MTHSRRGDKILLWNIANDYVVNMDPVEGNVGEKIRLVDICFDYNTQRWIKEAYDDLSKQAEEEGRTEMSALDVHLIWTNEDDEGAQVPAVMLMTMVIRLHNTLKKKTSIKEQSKNATQAAKVW